jgi:hypothetical protein
MSLLLAISFTVWFIGIARFPEKYKIFRRKPFNCEYCLPIWVAVISGCFAIYQYEVVQLLAYAFTAAVIAPLIISKI